MTLPRTVADVLTDHVVFEIESIDRMYLNVYVPRSAVRDRPGAVHPPAAGACRSRPRSLLAPAHEGVRRRRCTASSALIGSRGSTSPRGSARTTSLHEYLAAFEAAGGTEGVLFVGRAQEKTTAVPDPASAAP